MLLTFLIDPPFLLLLGYLFAFALPLHATVPIIRSRALKAGLITVTIFNLAVALSYLRYPDWIWMYQFDTARWSHGLQTTALVGGVAAYYLLFVLGFFWGLRTRTRMRTHLHWLYGIGLLCASGLIIWPVFDQYFHVGTFAEYAAGAAIPLPQSPLALLYNLTLPLMVLTGALLFRWARHDQES